MSHKDSEVASDESWQTRIAEFYDLVVSDSQEVRIGGFLPVNTVVAAQVFHAIGVDVSKFRHIIETNIFRHIIKTHGQPSEAKRGQTPLGKDDFLNLLEVITKPDTVTSDGETKQKLKVLCFTKEVGGYNLYYKISVRPGKKQIGPVTLYKRKVKT